MSGDAEAVDMPLATRAGFERALVEQTKALALLAEGQQAINESIVSCVESISSAPAHPEKATTAEEWEAVVTQRDGPYIKSVKFRRVK